MIALASLASFCVCLALLALVLRGQRHWAIDVPNERSLHSDPTPRSGGVAIVAGIGMAAALAAAGFEQVPLAAIGLAIGLCGVSLADDRNGLPIALRLATHLLAAGVFAAYLSKYTAPWWWMLLAMLAMAAMTNFFNFMDGANGLAGGMAVVGFASYGSAAFADAAGMAAVCFGIAAAAAGFLIFNLQGKIFMGDGGSVPLGFLAAALGMEGWMQGLWPSWFPVLVFAPFIADAVATLAMRIARRERFWEAHREHHYQRLVRSGWTHSRLACAAYALMAACAGLALGARATDGGLRTLAFASTAALLAGSGLLVNRHWRRYTASQKLPR